MNSFAEFSRRHLITAAVILFMEVILYRQYAAIDAEFHFWLHGLFGASLGLLAITVWKLLRPGVKTPNPVGVSFVGHLYSAVPDIIFMAFGALHMYWMDVFALHITIHFIPSPVPAMLLIFILCLMAYGFAADGSPKLSAMAILFAGVLLVIALSLRSSIPTSLEDMRGHNHRHAWLCPMIESPSLELVKN